MESEFPSERPANLNVNDRLYKIISIIDLFLFKNWQKKKRKSNLLNQLITKKKENVSSKNLKKRRHNFKGGFTTIKNDQYMVGCKKRVFLFIR
jgi:hypothetical protein